MKKNMIILVALIILASCNNINSEKSGKIRTELLNLVLDNKSFDKAAAVLEKNGFIIKDKDKVNGMYFRASERGYMGDQVFTGIPGKKSKYKDVIDNTIWFFDKKGQLIDLYVHLTE